MTGELLPRVERTDGGRPLWIHECTDLSFNPAEAVLPLGSRGWEWTADGGLTPSILCRNCGTHGFWTGGETPTWRPC